MPKVSVIIPVYNGERTVKRCIDSVISQTLEDIEIIIIDDGSTDDTPKLLGEITDNRVKVITTPNAGQGAARNLGIDAAKGEYLAFVDADDTVDENMLGIMYEAAKRTGADVAECNIRDIYPDGREKIQLQMSNETVFVTDAGEYMDTFLTPCRHSYEVCNKLIKRHTAADLRFKDTKKYFSEDLLFNMELIRHIKRITFIDKPLYNYYQSENSHMHKNTEARLKGLTALFRDFISGEDDIKNSASYTAAMVLAYSSGDCADSVLARTMYASEEFKGYIRRALKRRVSKKHRVFLIAMRFAPVQGKAWLCKWYAARWKI